MTIKQTSNISVQGENFSIEIKTIFKLMYIQNEKTMLIMTEPLSGKHSLGIDPDTIKVWNSPYEKELLTVEEKQIILINIIDGLKELRINAISL